MGDQVTGPHRVQDLQRLPGFTLNTLVRKSESSDWQQAYMSIDLPLYFSRPERAKSIASAVARTAISQALVFDAVQTRSPWARAIVVFSFVLWSAALTFYATIGRSMWREPAMQRVTQEQISMIRQRINVYRSNPLVQQWQRRWSGSTQALRSRLPNQMQSIKEQVATAAARWSHSLTR